MKIEIFRNKQAREKKGVMLRRRRRFWDMAILSRAIDPIIRTVCGIFEQLYLCGMLEFFHSVFFPMILNVSALRTAEKVIFEKGIPSFLMGQLQ